MDESMDAGHQTQTRDGGETPSDYALAGDVSIRDVDALAADLRDRLARGALAIRTGDLQSIDVAVLQLLLSARKSASAAGSAFSIDADEAGTLALAIDRAGLRREFDDVLIAGSA
ncbi:STAS domain-containing protein [Jiella sonneratiae]|uniref:STAS domain-containing protein n=1 Tax=Jiella sonneratiae TaxID=2816856 RepID=A0ABS3IZM2_9HYPH|nr:STAS domain-containing protein [Jiella sonneratiae]MBO0902859.1 STAS domain-containing protein [Jiella sonneratiae]